MFQSTPLLCMRVRPSYLPCSNLSLKCFASYSDGSPSHSWLQSSPCFASFSSRYFSASWTVRSAFGWDKPLFSFVMVFTVTDLGGVFHLRTVGRSNDMYSGCTTAFNLFFMSGKPSAFNCVRCTLPEKSSDPYSSGSDFAFVFGSSILQACSCPFRASLQLTFRAHVLYCCFSATPFSVVSA